MEIRYSYPRYKNLRDVFTQKYGCTFAVVSECKEKMSKNGNPYLQVSLEDKESTFDLFLFNKDIMDYGKYLIKECFVYLEYELVADFYNKGEKTMKITYADLLRLADDKKKMVVTDFDPNSEEGKKLFNFINENYLHELYYIEQ